MRIYNERMSSISIRNYKGIAVFGAPGSGKTTLAKSIIGLFSDGKYVEASDAVIYPASSIKDFLPDSENAFIRKIAKIYGKRVRLISREKAQKFFVYLKNKYTPSVIAKTLIFIHKKYYPRKILIISGIRGFRNSAHVKKAGYLVVYLKMPNRHSARRFAKRESYSRKTAEREQKIEERLFSTNKVEKIAHLSFNTAVTPYRQTKEQIKAMVEAKECKKCANSSVNLSGYIGKSGLCDVCEKYKLNFNKEHLKRELELLLSFRNARKGKYDALIGISGGKDSTATLYTAIKLGFTPLAFSFDTGYYSKHISQRAKSVAKKLGVDYKQIDIRKYIRLADRLSFKKMAELYSEKDSAELKEKFRRWYVEGRRHYSIKCEHAIPFVRTCQLCRRIVVRAYFGEALKYGVKVVILGINEWAGLSQDSESKKFIFSAVRKLKPFKNKPAVYIAHLPFLLQRKIKDTRKILKKLGWKIPRGEELIESNANSCLFARAAENKARRMLGFHPDTSRLSREVTVGFITKAQAKKALAKVHNYQYSVASVLKKAKII